jgi:uncharacterized protein (DUF1778 family)
MPNTARMERIDLRTTKINKFIIQKAAELKNTTVSAYLIDSALQKAREDIQNMEVLHLGDTDRDLFFSLLSDPPQPNRALQNLFKSVSR